MSNSEDLEDLAVIEERKDKNKRLVLRSEFFDWTEMALSILSFTEATFG